MKIRNVFVSSLFFHFNVEVIRNVFASCRTQASPSRPSPSWRCRLASGGGSGAAPAAASAGRGSVELETSKRKTKFRIRRGQASNSSRSSFDFGKQRFELRGQVSNSQGKFQSQVLNPPRPPAGQRESVKTSEVKIRRTAVHICTPAPPRRFEPFHRLVCWLRLGWLNQVYVHLTESTCTNVLPHFPESYSSENY